MPRNFSLPLLALAAAIAGLTPKPALAQNRGVELSETVKFANVDVAPNVVLPLDEGFALYTFRSVMNSRPRQLAAVGVGRNRLDEVTRLDLHRYDDDLRSLGSVPLSWSGARDLLSVFSLGESIVWTYATETDDRNRYAIHAATYRPDGTETDNYRLMDLDRRDYGGLEVYAGESAARDYHVRVFAEQSPQRLLSKRDDEPAAMTVAVFSREGELVTHVTERLEVARDQLDIQSVSVDDEGNAYVAARVFTTSKGRETNGGSDSDVFVYDVDRGGESLARTRLELAGQYIAALEFFPVPDGPPTVLGLYTERRGDRLRGVFAASDPTSGQTLRPQRFSQELLESLGRRVTAGKGDRLRLEGDFEFLDSQILPDGSLAVLLEDYRVTTTVDPNTGRVRTTFQYGEGIVMTFDAEGELYEAWVVPKFQAEVNQVSPFVRMKLIPYAGGVGVLYNDNPKNLTRSLDERTKSMGFRNSVAVLAYIDNGELERRPLFGRLEADKLLMAPSSGVRLATGDVVFVAKRFKMFGKNQLRLGLVAG